MGLVLFGPGDAVMRMVLSAAGKSVAVATLSELLEGLRKIVSVSAPSSRYCVSRLSAPMREANMVMVYGLSGMSCESSTPPVGCICPAKRPVLP